MKRILSTIGLLAFAAGVGLTGCGDGGSRAEGDTVAVQSVAMLTGTGSVGVQDRYAGIVVAQQTQEINKEEERSVGELKVAVGDEVKAGDVLFTYDTEELQLSIEMGQLELEKLQNTIDSTNDQIAQLKKDRDKASSADRLSYSIEIQTLEAENKENEYTLNTKKVEQERLEKTMENTEVKSEIDGIVQSINENGSADEYGNSQAYIVLMETGTYRVKGTVNEMNMAAISGMEGQPILIRSRVNAEETWNGTLEGVDMENPEANGNNYYYMSSDESTQSSKYPFYVTLDSSEGLMMGQHVYIEMDQGQDEAKEGIWIPSVFLDMANGGSYVWAATEKDKLERRAVTLGEYNEMTEEYQILEGLSAEDYIALYDESLKEGQAVTRYDDAYFSSAGEDIPMDVDMGAGDVEGMPEDGADSGMEVVPEGDDEMRGEEVNGQAEEMENMPEAVGEDETEAE